MESGDLYAKINDIKENKIQNYSGIFEDILYDSYHNDSWDLTMSRKNLIKNFTENAVKFTSNSFSKHFKEKIKNIDQKYLDLLVNKKSFMTNSQKIIKNFDKAKFYTNDIIKFY